MHPYAPCRWNCLSWFSFCSLEHTLCDPIASIFLVQILHTVFSKYSSSIHFSSHAMPPASYILSALCRLMIPTFSTSSSCLSVMDTLPALRHPIYLHSREQSEVCYLPLQLISAPWFPTFMKSIHPPKYPSHKSES